MKRRYFLHYGIACSMALALKTIAFPKFAGASEMIPETSNRMIAALVGALRSIGTARCLMAADDLERSTDRNGNIMLHVRSAGIDCAGAVTIAAALKSVSNEEASPLVSFSLSYNNALGDAGAIALAEALPLSLRDLGLVGCNIGDEGGMAVLEWAKEADDLRMICIEHNQLSSHLKMQFRRLPIPTIFV